MATPRRPTDERRAEIVEAALRLIGAKGIAALTVSALARELGFTGGALYKHFPSTEAILEAVAARAVEALDASTPEASLPPRAWIRALAEARTATVSGHAGLSRLLLSEQFVFALPPPAVSLLKGAVRKTREGLVRAIREGQRVGEIRDDLPAEALAPIVLGTIQMIAMHRAGPLLPRVEGDPLALIDTVLALLAPREFEAPTTNASAPRERRATEKRRP